MTTEMSLRYVIPLEHDMESIFLFLECPVFMVSSSGIPVLYALANTESYVTAIDFDKSQFLLLNVLSSAARNLDREYFLRFVSRDMSYFQSLDTLHEISNDIMKRFHFFTSYDIESLVDEYRDIVNQCCEEEFMKW
ncbi:MAG: hypothetical protein QMD85_03660, partial [Candidatus Aenigmarchaeota archaeon]|nr:hypothetical protein [Candidatus Aenigmarchaeota archaeon]MDI6722652.1 hypothetical protein [Candidatus Aenigmarchaeota archaeon]